MTTSLMGAAASNLSMLALAVTDRHPVKASPAEPWVTTVSLNSSGSFSTSLQSSSGLAVHEGSP